MKKPASIGNKRTNVISIPVPPDWHCFAMDFRLDFLVQEAGSSRLLKARIATKGLMMQILPAEVYGRGARAMVARVKRDDLVKCFAACPDFTVKVHGTSAPSTLWLAAADITKALFSDPAQRKPFPDWDWVRPGWDDEPPAPPQRHPDAA